MPRRRLHDHQGVDAAVSRRCRSHTGLSEWRESLKEILLYAGSTALAPPTGGAVRLELKVEGMGCEACQLAVAGALQRASGVLDAAADFETGTASLLVQPSWGLELGELAARVEAAGFELDVENVSGAM